MGSTTKYKSRDLVYVPTKIVDADDGQGGVSSSVTVNYGFETNIAAADRTTLGQTAVNLTALPTKLVIGANFPKPARASKREPAKYVSSYCSTSLIASLRAKGWRITRSRGVAPLKLENEANSLVQTVYVTVEGVKRAWNIPEVTLGKIGADATALGITEAVANDLDELVFGCEFPMPPRAQKIVGDAGDGDNQNTYSTFYEPGKTLPTGWNHIKRGILKLN